VYKLLTHKDSPYIRGIGLLYLRLLLDPKQLWEWMSPYLDDTELLNAAIDKSQTTTIGEFARKLLVENHYFGLTMKRLPVPVARDFQLKVRCLLSRLRA